MVAMALALYRRYRPDTFDGVIGQDQVTVPLKRALDEGKLTHAYLFSGPRGCGKTSSARILARCVNCEQGPTSHPCGECASCRDLATGGPGSIDVVEIDAASHNGVDDARDLRERAGFAPARDRYKIFILDEAHMVTQQGFNALLKIVEEPPEHVMFIFATTEPEKVIGTIRSRTHHYPFRLVPQEIMGPYLEEVCAKEGLSPEPGVLRLAIRSGGGSMRDTLSVLDQLMVGAVDGVIGHDAAVALLGFTPETLIGEAVDAVIDEDGERLYGVVQQVVVGGYDPRRFIEDLLARVRDILVLSLGGERAERVLSDDAAERMEDVRRQAQALSLADLTAMADTLNDALKSMSGTTSPRMRLELLAAKLLANRQQPVAASRADVAIAGGGAASNGAVESVVAAGGAAGMAAGVATTAAVQSAGSAPVAAVAPTGSARSAASSALAAVQAARSAYAPSTSARISGASDSQGVATTAAAPATSEASTMRTAAAAPAGAAAQSTRSLDERWDAVVAALPESVRDYVTRDKVPTVALAVDGSGKSRLSMTFDCSLSQHAFALAVDTSAQSGGEKAAKVVLAAARAEFGAGVMIAPSQVAANGERVEAVSRMSPEQLAQVKKHIAMVKANEALAGTRSAGADGAASRESQTQAESTHGDAASSSTDDDHHREHEDHRERREPSEHPGESRQRDDSTQQQHDADPWAESDPWDMSAQQEHTESTAQSEVTVASQSGSKHVDVPDVSDDIDPWADQPSMEELRERAAKAQAEQAQTSVPSRAAAMMPAEHADSSVVAMPSHDVLGGQMKPSAFDEWSRSNTAPDAPQVAAEEDEYSLSDESLSTSTSLDVQELSRLFEVKKIEEFAAGDARHPLAKTHQ